MNGFILLLNCLIYTLKYNPYFLPKISNSIAKKYLLRTPKSTKKLTTKKSLKTKQKCENITSTMPEKALSSFIKFVKTIYPFF